MGRGWRRNRKRWKQIRVEKANTWRALPPPGWDTPVTPTLSRPMGRGTGPAPTRDARLQPARSVPPRSQAQSQGPHPRTELQELTTPEMLLHSIGEETVEQGMSIG